MQPLPSNLFLSPDNTGWKEDEFSVVVSNPLIVEISSIFCLKIEEISDRFGALFLTSQAGLSFRVYRKNGEINFSPIFPKNLFGEIPNLGQEILFIREYLSPLSAIEIFGAFYGKALQRFLSINEDCEKLAESFSSFQSKMEGMFQDISSEKMIELFRVYNRK